MGALMKVCKLLILRKAGILASHNRAGNHDAPTPPRTKKLARTA